MTPCTCPGCFDQSQDPLCTRHDSLIQRPVLAAQWVRSGTPRMPKVYLSDDPVTKCIFLRAAQHHVIHSTTSLFVSPRFFHALWQTSRESPSRLIVRCSVHTRRMSEALFIETVQQDPKRHVPECCLMSASHASVCSPLARKRSP